MNAAIIGAVTAILGMVVYFFNRRFEIKTEAIGSLQSKRLEALPKLWEAVTGICTPSPLPRKKSSQANQSNGTTLAHNELVSARNDLSTWYAEKGVYLDAESRLWALLLREACSKVIRDRSRSKLRWWGSEWPTLWLIKTALRVSLESALSAPVMRGGRAWPRRPQRPQPPQPPQRIEQRWRPWRPWLLWLLDWLLDWLPWRIWQLICRRRKRLKNQLALKFKLVDALAPTGSPSRDGDERSKLIDKVLNAFYEGNAKELFTQSLSDSDT